MEGAFEVRAHARVLVTFRVKFEDVAKAPGDGLGLPKGLAVHDATARAKLKRVVFVRRR